jgi:hypothetical protein
MPRVGFEPKIPVCERAKTVHVLDGTITVIGIPATVPRLSSIIRGWYNSPISGRRVRCTGVSSHPKENKKKNTYKSGREISEFPS